jgi:hypothetical protein
MVVKCCGTDVLAAEVQCFGAGLRFSAVVLGGYGVVMVWWGWCDRWCW